MSRIELICLALIFCSFIAFAESSVQDNKSYKVVCYLGSWANYRLGDGKFVIEDIDPTLCTHLIYGFTKLQDNKITPFDPNLDLKENWGLGAYKRFNALRSKNPALKTLVAIGGWNEGSVKYSQMVASPASRKTFVGSCLSFLATHGFNGLDLDWEYPANRGGSPADKANFVLLIKELREAFQPHGYLLSAAVSAGQNTIDSAYDVPALGKYLDFINLMTYDFHGGWDKVTGHNAPLYAAPNAIGQDKLNVDYAVQYWLSNGAPANKLILGMPLYGRGFTLQDPNNNGLGAPAAGKGMAGKYTSQAGMMGYNEICKILKEEKDWTITFESHIQAPFAVKGKQWIGYDNVESIALKVKYVQKMKLGGGMVWSLETDDFKGQCHGRKYPLLRTIHDGLEGETIPINREEKDKEPDNSISSTSQPDLSSTSATTTDEHTSESKDSLPCPHSGYFKNPQDCKLFYYCQPNAASSGANIYHSFHCAEGTVFNEELGVCDFPNAVPGCH